MHLVNQKRIKIKTYIRYIIIFSKTILPCLYIIILQKKKWLLPIHLYILESIVIGNLLKKHAKQTSGIILHNLAHYDLALTYHSTTTFKTQKLVLFWWSRQLLNCLIIIPGTIRRVVVVVPDARRSFDAIVAIVDLTSGHGQPIAKVGAVVVVAMLAASVGAATTPTRSATLVETGSLIYENNEKTCIGLTTQIIQKTQR